MSATSERPAAVCKALLAALGAAEGRRRARKRDQTADAIGLALKRELLRRAIEDDPAPGVFEEWLVAYTLCRTGEGCRGSLSAMARSVFEEWQLARAMNDFSAWLERGAPSDDAG